MTLRLLVTLSSSRPTETVQGAEASLGAALVINKVLLVPSESLNSNTRTSEALPRRVFTLIELAVASVTKIFVPGRLKAPP